jgi:hypothetical protein
MKHSPTKPTEKPSPTTIKLQFLKAVMADPGLSPQAKCVMHVLVMTWHCDKTGRCNPCLSKIAKGVGASRRHVIRAVQEVKASGWMDVISGGPPDTSNQYRFDFSRRGDESVTTVVTDLTERGDKAVTQTSYEPLHTPPMCVKRGEIEEDHPLGGGGLEGAPPMDGKKENKNAAEGEHGERDFQKFWQQFPKHEGEDGARREYTRLIDAGVNPAEITAGAMRYAAAVEGKPAQFVAMPANWLRDGRWKDQPQSGPTNGNGHAVNGTPYRRKPSVLEVTDALYTAALEQERGR